MEPEPCIFCTPETKEILLENKGAYAKFDLNPVSRGHILIIPKRHIGSIFDASSDEMVDLWNLLILARNYAEERFNPDGYNLGINDGPSAGQTIMHLHIHLIPRYSGDMPDPRGGVRGVIPHKQQY